MAPGVDQDQARAHHSYAPPELVDELEARFDALVADGMDEEDAFERAVGDIACAEASSPEEADAIFRELGFELDSRLLGHAPPPIRVPDADEFDRLVADWRTDWSTRPSPPTLTPVVAPRVRRVRVRSSHRRIATPSRRRGTQTPRRARSLGRSADPEPPLAAQGGTP